MCCCYATGAPLPQESAPGTALSPPRRLDNIAEAAAAAVLRKQSQVPVVAGIVKSAVWDTSGDISVTVFPACKAHAHVPGSCCSQVHHSVAPILSALASLTLQLGATLRTFVCVQTVQSGQMYLRQTMCASTNLCTLHIHLHAHVQSVNAVMHLEYAVHIYRAHHLCGTAMDHAVYVNAVHDVYKDTVQSTILVCMHAGCAELAGQAKGMASRFGWRSHLTGA